MDGESFQLYSNRSTNVHVLTYINPEGERFVLDSRKMPEPWPTRLSAHHAIVRVAHSEAVGTKEWEELLRIPWMKANEQLWGAEDEEPPSWTKPLPPHIPGFFIPPEELDGLE